MVPSWFSAEELAGLADFWVVYRANHDALNASAMKALLAEPQLAPLVAAMPPEQLAAQQRADLARMQKLIDGDWTEYITSIQQQGPLYAKLGVSFSTWSRLLRVVVREVTPLLVEQYGGEPRRLTRALASMQSFFDFAISTLGETYLASKEDDLRTLAQDLATTLDSIGDGVIATDLEGRVTRMNPVAEALTGWPIAKARGLPLAQVFNVINEQTREPIENPVTRVLSTGSIVGLANHAAIITPDGRETPIADSAAPIRDDSGAMRGVVLVFRDQTIQHKADAALAASERRYRRFSEAGLMGVLEFTRDGRITEANDVFLRMVGRSAADVGKLTWKDLTPDEFFAADAQAEVEALDGGAGKLYEKELITSRGRLPVLVGYATLEGEKRIAFVLDISQQKQLEGVRVRSLQLESDNRRIQEANRLKSEFLANMSHELRTPLNAIIGFADLLHDDQVPHDSPQFKEFLGDILRSGRHLLQLINDVLDLSKVEAGRVEFFPELVSLQRVVGEVVAILRTTASNKRITITTDIAPELDSLFLDAGRLKQVLYNYLSNALKFTPDGGKVTVRGSLENEAQFRLEVIDSGIGIDKGDLEKLFIEFQQLDAGAAKKHAGTGLGLALTRRLAEAQGGAVGVTSTKGKGSTFFAVLPRVASGTPALASRRFAGAKGAPAILVIEDNEKDQAAIVEVLVAAGYEVETASNATQATARCASRSFDAITLDLELPDASGVDVLRIIRSGERNRDVPVIVITVVTDKGAAGGFVVHDILGKPLDAEEILRSLSRAGVKNGRDGHVLVVDDDAGSLKLMSTTLSQFNYGVVTVSSAAEGLRKVAETRPMAVVLDLMMPEMDGFEFLERFRKLDGCADIPVLIWSAKDLTPEEFRRLKNSAQGVLQKGQDAGSAVLSALRTFIPPPVAKEER